MIGNFPAVSNSTAYFSNSTGSFVTNCRFSPHHCFRIVDSCNRQTDPFILLMICWVWGVCDKLQLGYSSGWLSVWLYYEFGIPTSIGFNAWLLHIRSPFPNIAICETRRKQAKSPRLRPPITPHLTFRPVLAVKLLGIMMLRNRCWPTIFLPCYKRRRRRMVLELVGVISPSGPDHTKQYVRF